MLEKNNIKKHIEVLLQLQRFSGKRRTLNVFMLRATTSPFKCARASEESQLISSAVCQQRGPDASQAAARGANERRWEHLPFKSKRCCASVQHSGFCFVFFPLPRLHVQRTRCEQGEDCRFKRFSLNWTVSRKSFTKRVSLMCGPKYLFHSQRSPRGQLRPP